MQFFSTISNPSAFLSPLLPLLPGVHMMSIPQHSQRDAFPIFIVLSKSFIQFTREWRESCRHKPFAITLAFSMSKVPWKMLYRNVLVFRAPRPAGSSPCLPCCSVPITLAASESGCWYHCILSHWSAISHVMANLKTSFM